MAAAVAGVFPECLPAEAFGGLPHELGVAIEGLEPKGLGAGILGQHPGQFQQLGAGRFMGLPMASSRVAFSSKASLGKRCATTVRPQGSN